MKFTLDMNAIISIENNDVPDCNILLELISLHGESDIEVRICMESASERQRDKMQAKTSAIFKERIEQLGLSHLSIIYPTGIFGHNYWGDSLWASKDDDKPEKEILKVLFNSDDFTSLSNNQICDVNILSAHIINGGGVFVTQDKNFLKKKDKLIPIAEQYYNCQIEILPPNEALLKAKEFLDTRSPEVGCPE
jgi:hypothetical protein